MCLLETCNFRKVPQSTYYDDDLASEPWYTVNDNDYFPEEFEHFMGLSGAIRQAFYNHHADLFDVAYWHSVQAQLKAGEVIDIFPYHHSRRLKYMQV